MTPATEKKEMILRTARSLFLEFAMHHHYYCTSKEFGRLELKTQDREIYFNILESHNFTMLAITFCKTMEFYRAFHREIPSELKQSFKSINKRLELAKIQDFRNKFAGHLFDKETGKPLKDEDLQTYALRLLNGQTHDEFRSWWWPLRGEDLQKSVAGNLQLLRLSLNDNTSECGQIQ